MPLWSILAIIVVVVIIVVSSYKGYKTYMKMKRDDEARARNAQRV